MIRHIVTWKLKAEDAAGQAASIAAIAGALEPLVGVVPDLVALKVHPNVATFDTNWPVVLVADYPSVAALDAYQIHPAHVKAAAIVRGHVSARAAIDFEI
jgi:hypothetical protein